MSAWSPAPASPSSASTSSASTRIGRQDRRRCGGARSRSTSPASTSSSQRNAEAGRLSFTDRPRRARSTAPTPSSSPSARRPGAATAMPTSPTSSPPPRRSPARSTATRSSSPSRPCRSAPAARSQSIIRASRDPDADFDVASNPEFLREGSAIEDFMRPGPGRRRRRERAGARGHARSSTGRSTSSRRRSSSPTLETAELIKYAANAFLATKITFINEMADLCEQVGADVQDVAARHRPGRAHRPQVPARRARATAAPAFPRTRWRWLRTAQEAGAPLADRRDRGRGQRARKQRMAEKIVAACGGSSRGKTIARARPHLQAQHRRHARQPEPGHRARAAGRAPRSAPSTPRAWRRPKSSAGVDCCDDAYEAIEGADALVVITEWNSSGRSTWSGCTSLHAQPLIVDLRNIYDPGEMAAPASTIPASAGRFPGRSRGQAEV